MPTPPLDDEISALPGAGDAEVLRLLVRNHPGVLSHVSGLFARRAFNLDGILCLPVGDGTRSAILLLVRQDGRLEQLVRQLAKLEDVLEVAPAPSGRRAFASVAPLLEPGAAAVA
ncbi:ACT domain-containing protein [Candidatus Binatia bacterium]|jgi:acetolactate synthase-1/3 small subunit|nr:ACT domain-containing protein [Candidatus Binatia bacterium]